MARPPHIVQRKIILYEFEIKQGVEVYEAVYRLVLLVAELGAFPDETAFFKIADDAGQVGAARLDAFPDFLPCQSVLMCGLKSDHLDVCLGSGKDRTVKFVKLPAQCSVLLIAQAVDVPRQGSLGSIRSG